ncbi:high frequency lysogenization protein HflD [Vibrio profundum]|uniref:high frequency lysogenization protein HflD n=1 Tax=Vibrio profundum TaxID=2910247 RepID=UPI003D11616A
MANTTYDRTVAFAGLCQAVALVQEVAKNGHCDSHALETSLKAILNTNPSSTLAVYGTEADLKVGLETSIQLLNSTPSSSDITRYILGLLALERKLNSRRDAMSQLGDRISMLERQSLHYELLEDQMVSNLASVYLDVISPIGPRIQITGTPDVLQQTSNQHKVRALLLSGIRSAVLWRQVGGKRRHLVFNRKALLEQATNLLSRYS